MPEVPLSTTPDRPRARQRGDSPRPRIPELTSFVNNMVAKHKNSARSLRTKDLSALAFSALSLASRRFCVQIQRQTRRHVLGPMHKNTQPERPQFSSAGVTAPIGQDFLSTAQPQPKLASFRKKTPCGVIHSSVSSSRLHKSAHYSSGHDWRTAIPIRHPLRQAATHDIPSAARRRTKLASFENNLAAKHKSSSKCLQYKGLSVLVFSALSSAPQRLRVQTQRPTRRHVPGPTHKIAQPEPSQMFTPPPLASFRNLQAPPKSAQECTIPPVAIPPGIPDTMRVTQSNET